MSFSWVSFFIVALGLKVLSIFCLEHSAALREWGLIFLLFSIANALAAPVVIVSFILWSHWQSIKETIGNPTKIPLWNAKITSTTDARFLPLVMEQPLEDIEFVRLEVSTERGNFERRVSLLIGAIEKIGIYPAILAALGSLQALTLPSSWIDLLSYALAAMYFLGLPAHVLLMRLDRMLKLLDLAVVRKKAELEGPTNGAPSAGAAASATLEP